MSPIKTNSKKYTKQVEDNNKVYDVKSGWLSRLTGDKDSAIPRYADQKSPIKHVIYVINENRDQVFGDLGKGNGDPSLTQFGKSFTPNLHKLATQFVTLDNFYADGEVSEQGHPWMILGMKPMTQFDASAIPMLNSFTNHPNLDPYKVEQLTYPLNAMNGQNAPMAAVSKQMDFSKPDAADSNKLNQAIWKATKGNQPYPISKK
ncbi:hypothetical protein PP175_10490 [Aneurinibacillus sp. Ricciae_BoGa-3]|uniref:hypothetical protein n=1 Tax=Aneurinibacillus sp. Ricciae_BoGa-3 TaxID=3022697 RepID=UPI00234002F7|nr:hypothetical protein [Aneurinibacillus sp. Ricciae_BoGa-3]WCK56298.1 hypothetical protein PP175_10490 [Aneurinibacillus sp. Ricciae_BoGa-3]